MREIVWHAMSQWKGLRSFALISSLHGLGAVLQNIELQHFSWSYMLDRAPMRIRVVMDRIGQAMLRNAARVLCFDVSGRVHAAASMTAVPAWHGPVPVLIA